MDETKNSRKGTYWLSRLDKRMNNVITLFFFAYPASTTKMSPSSTFSYISILSVVVFFVPTRAFVGRGGWENLTTGDGTWDRAEFFGEVARGI